MEEYVKKSAILSKEFEAEINTYDGKHDGTVAYVILASDIHNLPIEDVTPVRRGIWILREIEGTLRWKECSVCKGTIHNVSYNYCPHCGAKMNTSNKEN